MRILAVDFGDARSGLAVCDSRETVATSIGNADGKGIYNTAVAVANTVKERGVGMVVVGLPINMDGTEGKRAEKCRVFANALRNEIGDESIEVVLWDERSTTVQAYRNLLAADVKGSKKRGIIDSEAARIILDSYLSYRARMREIEGTDKS